MQGHPRLLKGERGRSTPLTELLEFIIVMNGNGLEYVSLLPFS